MNYMLIYNGEVIYGVPNTEFTYFILYMLLYYRLLGFPNLFLL